MLQKITEIIASFKSSKIISLIILLLIVAAIPLTVFISQRQQEIRQRASEESEIENLAEKKKPEFAPGELIIKFKQKQNIRYEAEKGAQIIDLERDPALIQDIDNQTLPLSLRAIKEKYKVDKLEKVFKDNLKSVNHQSEPETAQQNVSSVNSNLDKIYKLSLEKSTPLEEIVEEIKRNPDIEYVEPNYKVKIASIPNDPYYSTSGSWGQTYPDLWGIKKLNLENAWDGSSNSTSIVIAGIDTGVDRNHEDLKENMWINSNETPSNGIDDDNNGYVDDYYGWDFVNNDNDPMDDNGHGTHTAGTIAAVGNNGIGVIGISPTSKIMALKFLGANGEGYDSGAAMAIKYAADMGAKISSNSWGSESYSYFVNDILRYAYQKGVTNIVAAGNSNMDALLFFPASSDYVITVAASDHNDAKAIFSNWGEKIDVAAPGMDILSTKSAVGGMCRASDIVGNNYCRVSGTSMATPHVSGLAALLLTKDQTLTNEEIRQIIRTGTVDLGETGKDINFGYGRIEGALSISNLANRTLTPFIKNSSKSYMSGKNYQFLGSINGPNFAGYKLEYRPMYTLNWINLIDSKDPITNEVISTIDTTILNEGNHTFRLQAINTENKKYEFQIYNVEVDNFQAIISSPITILPNGLVEISGTASTSYGVNFGRYKIEWGEGKSPSVWTDSGITLINDGRQPVYSGQLGTWDTSTLTNGNTYNVRLTVYNEDNVSYKTEIYLPYDSSLRAGWPKLIESSWYETDKKDKNVVVSDLENDGKKEMIIVSDINYILDGFWVSGKYMNIYVLGIYGKILSGWPIQINFPIDLPIFMGITPSVGDVDGDGVKEIIVQSPDGVLYVYNKSGMVLNGWPKAASSTNFNSYIPPLLEDLDRDGKLEVIADQGGKKIHAYKYDGTELSGWPVSVDSNNGAYSKFSIGDIDGDGFKEVIITIGEKIYVYKKDGNILSGWPYTLTNGYLWEGLNNSPVTADFNGDSKAEIVALASNNVSGLTKLYLLNNNGILVNNWPKDGSNKVQWGTPAIGDLNNDGKLEVVYGDYGNYNGYDGQKGKIYAYNYDGSILQNFPITYKNDFYSFDTHPIIADIDNDNKKEIIIKGYKNNDKKYSGQIFAFDLDGNIKQGFPKQSIGYPTIADIDSDGKLELIYTGRVSADAGREYVYVINLLSNYYTTSLDWPHYLHNERHTGSNHIINLPISTPTPILTTPTPVVTSTPTPTNAPTPIPCTACRADINIDGKVNSLDYARMAACWGKSASDLDEVGNSCSLSDLDGSGFVDDPDNTCLRSKYFQSCAEHMPSATPSLVITSTPVLRQVGDINGDGNINIIDYEAWRNIYKTTKQDGLGCPTDQINNVVCADLNKNGTVDLLDFNIWFVAINK